MYNPLNRIITYNRTTRTAWKLFKFACVGAVGTLVSLAVLYGLTEWFHIYYMLSAILGALAGLGFNFTGNVKNGLIRLDNEDEKKCS